MDKRWLITLLAALAAFNVVLAQDDGALSERAVALREADQTHATARNACAAMSGAARSRCQTEADNRHKRTRAQIAAEHASTDQARVRVREEAADADYALAKAKCGTARGEDKARCIEQAQADRVKAKADIRSSQVIAQVRREASAPSADSSAAEADAAFRAALERCDKVSGRAKEDCIGEARAKFSRN